MKKAAQLQQDTQHEDARKATAAIAKKVLAEK
jgi:hypothetical protein